MLFKVSLILFCQKFLTCRELLIWISEISSFYLFVLIFYFISLSYYIWLNEKACCKLNFIHVRISYLKFNIVTSYWTPIRFQSQLFDKDLAYHACCINKNSTKCHLNYYFCFERLNIIFRIYYIKSKFLLKNNKDTDFNYMNFAVF